jgi:EAL domain-containing protein (putative c-di-GMP-specific phosphodiesterase class I)
MPIFSRAGRTAKAKTGSLVANAEINALLGLARKRLNLDMDYIGEFSVGRGTPPDGLIGFAHWPSVVNQDSDYPETVEADENFGSFCCFSHDMNPKAEPREREKMMVFAKSVPEELQAILRNRVGLRDKAARIETVLEGKNLNILYQPVFRLWKNEVIGFECLARFPETKPGKPEAWFADAYAVGLGQQLEYTAIQMGLRWLWKFPDGIDLRINASPGLVMSGALAAALEGQPLERIVLEVTEHDPVTDYEAFIAMLMPLRRQGLRLAVDDAGAGHASLRHVLKLQPDIMKLDPSLIRNLETDRCKAVLVAALVRFAKEMGIEIVAEGIETMAELNLLREMGVFSGQGHYLGHPVALEAALAQAAPWEMPETGD